jgi:predicted esterase
MGSEHTLSCGCRSRIISFGLALFVSGSVSMTAWGQSQATLDTLLEQLKTQVAQGKRGEIFSTARHIAALNDARAIPTMIGLIESDNAYWTVYGIGYFGLNPLTGVRYDDLHHGPWWRKWWQANKDRFPEEVRALPIPEFPKTAEGRQFAAKPLDPATVILEPTLDDLLSRIKRQISGEMPGDVSLTARFLAELNDPRAIPTLIGVIDADNSSSTVYGVGYFGLRRLTDVEYRDFHHGPWWRKWWEANKGRFSKEVQALPIPDLPKTEAGRKFAANPPDPATVILEPTVDDLLKMLERRYLAGDRTGLWQMAKAIGEQGDPRAIPTLIGFIEADNTYDTVYGVGYFGLSRLTGVKYDESHDGAWWRKWWEDNKKTLAKDAQALEIPKFPKVEKRRTPQDPAADVADVPSEEILIGDDAKKRYFLIGAGAESKPPAQGYRLLLVLPGGDGSADFHPFVKRIYKHALSKEYLVAQLVAPQWDADQAQRLVWPIESLPWSGMKFSTEKFVHLVIGDVERRHKLDPECIFTLSWSSSGPAAYATSLFPDTRVTGSFVAMSVFKPETLPPLERADGQVYYILHSPQDFIPLRMAEQARDSLRANKATTELVTYSGGHGWHGDVYGNLQRGIRWLEEKCRRKAGGE